MSLNLEHPQVFPPPEQGVAIGASTDSPDPAGEMAENRLGSDTELSTRELLLSSIAKAYYLSLVLHIVAYVAAALVFFYFGNHLLDTESLRVSVRARLDDHELKDDAPFEQIPAMSVQMDSPSRLQQMSTSLEAVENGLLQTLKTQELPSLGGSDDNPDDSGGGNFLFKLPTTGLAVTKGSFTAWTVPENPAVGEWYIIIVEVRLPDAVKGYRLNDLSGSVKGTDGYGRRIPFDRDQQSLSSYVDEENKLRTITGSESVKVRDNKVQLVLRIPPANKNLVQDTIKIRSRRLRETQELELTFGAQ